jgi:hypothetical protein
MLTAAYLHRCRSHHSDANNQLASAERPAGGEIEQAGTTAIGTSTIGEFPALAVCLCGTCSVAFGSHIRSFCCCGLVFSRRRFFCRRIFDFNSGLLRLHQRTRRIVGGGATAASGEQCKTGHSGSGSNQFRRLHLEFLNVIVDRKKLEIRRLYEQFAFRSQRRRKG